MRKYFFVLVSIVFLILLSPNSAFAHVKYLVTEEETLTKSGTDFNWLMQVFLNPYNTNLMIITVVVALFVWFTLRKIPFMKREIKMIGKRANSYVVFIPWMLRLSLGISLIGSGVAGNLVSPAISYGVDSLAFLQILIGFFILAGLLVIPSALIAMVLYILAFTIDPYILGNFDYMAIALALIVLDNERPGIDDLVGFPKVSPLQKFKAFVPFILRLGIGGSLVYLAIYEKLLNPHLSEVVVTNFKLMNVFPVSPEMWVLSVAIIELILGTVLLLGIYTRFTSIAAFIVLSLSFFYFGEDVASHITLFGILSVLVVTRGGRFSLDNKLGLTNPSFK